MVTLINKGVGVSGSSHSNKIPAQHAASLAGCRLHEVVDLCRQQKIFGVYIDGTWWVSSAVLPELRALVLLRPSRHPRLPEIFARGGLS